MHETLTRVVHEPDKNESAQIEPDIRTTALLNLIESLERIGPFYSGSIRPLSAKRGLENIFVTKLGLNPFVAEQKAKKWMNPDENEDLKKVEEDRPLMFVFGHGGGIP